MCVPFVICSVTFFEFVLVIVVIECFCLFFVAFIVLFFLEFEHPPVVVSVILLILN